LSKSDGHAWGAAWDKPIWELHEDIALGVNCLRGDYSKAVPFGEITGSQYPIYYKKELNRLARHRKWGKIVHDEESWWNRQVALHAQNIVVVKEDGDVEKAQVVDAVEEEGDDDGYDGDDSEPHPHVYKWDDLEKRYQEGHGTFFFGPHSHQIEIPEEAKYEPVL
jgi:hypothetical protein